MSWAEAFQFYARLKRELRRAVLSAEASIECKKAVWEEIARVLEEKRLNSKSSLRALRPSS